MRGVLPALILKTKVSPPYSLLAAMRVVLCNSQNHLSHRVNGIRSGSESHDFLKMFLGSFEGAIVELPEVTVAVPGNPRSDMPCSTSDFSCWALFITLSGG